MSRENIYAIVKAVDAIIVAISHRRYRLITTLVLLIVILKILSCDMSNALISFDASSHPLQTTVLQSAAAALALSPTVSQ
jgi:hypothetical protein